MTKTQTQESEDSQPVGWVAERYIDGSVEWYDGNGQWVDSLNDAAWIYSTEERVDFEDANWVEVYAHEDGVLTTEPCPGLTECQDCRDVRRSVRDPIAQAVLDQCGAEANRAQENNADNPSWSSADVAADIVQMLVHEYRLAWSFDGDTPRDTETQTQEVGQ